ncbi:MAG TPA: hypothetical protein VFX53_04570 [Pedococcus sp.]|nr:hypothetical protein [Pedococcus sp.]
MIAPQPWPQGPVNVRIVYHDGTEVPVDLTFEGYSADGIADWLVVTPSEINLDAVKTIKADLWPGRCGIRFVEAERWA